MSCSHLSEPSGSQLCHVARPRNFHLNLENPDKVCADRGAEEHKSERTGFQRLPVWPGDHVQSKYKSSSLERLEALAFCSSHSVSDRMRLTSSISCGMTCMIKLDHLDQTESLCMCVKGPDCSLNAWCRGAQVLTSILHETICSGGIITLPMCLGCSLPLQAASSSVRRLCLCCVFSALQSLMLPALHRPGRVGAPQQYIALLVKALQLSLYAAPILHI